MKKHTMNLGTLSTTAIKQKLIYHLKLLYVSALICFSSFSLKSQHNTAIIDINDWVAQVEIEGEIKDRFAGHQIDYSILGENGPNSDLLHGCRTHFYLRFDYLSQDKSLLASQTVQDYNIDNESFYNSIGYSPATPLDYSIMGSFKETEYVPIPCTSEVIRYVYIYLYHVGENGDCDQGQYTINYGVFYPDNSSSSTAISGSIDHTYNYDDFSTPSENDPITEEGLVAFSKVHIPVNVALDFPYNSGLAIHNVTPYLSTIEGNGEQIFTVDIIGGCPPYIVEWENELGPIPNYVAQDCSPLGDPTMLANQVYGAIKLPWGYAYTVSVTDSEGTTATYEHVYDKPYSTEVTTTEVWNKNMMILEDVTIKAGGVLIIGTDGMDNDVNISFKGENTGIHVEKGGILKVLPGTHLRNDINLMVSDCYGGPWEGISIEGDWNVPHPDIDFTNPSIGGNPNHGLVIIDGATIEHAVVGINAYDLHDVVGAEVGGGIARITNSIFNNNETSIQLGRFYATNSSGNAQKSIIHNNDFNYFPKEDAVDNVFDLSTTIKHVILNRCQNVQVTSNDFYAETYLVSGKQKSIGIVAYNTDTNIGEIGETYSNTFENIYKGIDLYNTLSIASITNVINNNFIKVEKGLTLNSVPFSRVEGNRFEVSAPEEGVDSYGCLAIKSTGFDINSNEFITSEFNNETKGLVIIDSGSTTKESSIVSNNSFDGNFTVATQMENENKGLDLFCNAYINSPQNDWLLAPGTFLKDQGICEEDFPDLSFSNYWHSDSGDSNQKHINNLSGNTFDIYHDYISAPDLSLCVGFTASNLTDCSFGDNTFTRTCQLEYPEVDDLPNCDGDIAKRIRVLLKEGDKQAIIDLLECVDDHWANKILVGTLTDRRDFNEALYILDNKIPDTPQENADFKAVYYAYIQLLSGGTGKQATDAMQQTIDISKDGNSELQIIVQSYLAALHTTTEDRSSYKVGSNTKFLEEKCAFTLYPNPTKEQFTLTFKEKVDLETAPILSLWDGKGQKIKEWQIKNTNNQSFKISDVSNGVYFCRITGQNGVFKLVVIN